MTVSSRPPIRSANPFAVLATLPSNYGLDPEPIAANPQKTSRRREGVVHLRRPSQDSFILINMPKPHKSESWHMLDTDSFAYPDAKKTSWLNRFMPGFLRR